MPPNCLQSITVGISAQIEDGEGNNWFVDIYDWVNDDGFVRIGDLSSIGVLLTLLARPRTTHENISCVSQQQTQITAFRGKK